MTDDPVDAEKALRAAQKAVCHRIWPAPPCDGDDMGSACYKKHRAINRLARAAWLEPYTRMGLTPEVEPDWLPKEPR